MKSRRLGRRVVSYSQLCETLCPRRLAVDVFYTKFTTESQRNAEIAQRSFQIRTPPGRRLLLEHLLRHDDLHRTAAAGEIRLPVIVRTLVERSGPSLCKPAQRVQGIFLQLEPTPANHQSLPARYALPVVQSAVQLLSSTTRR